VGKSESEDSTQRLSSGLFLLELFVTCNFCMCMKGVLLALLVILYGSLSLWLHSDRMHHILKELLYRRNTPKIKKTLFGFRYTFTLTFTVVDLLKIKPLLIPTVLKNKIYKILAK